LSREITLGALAAKYRQSDRFPARFSTRSAYNYNLDNHILPKWKDEKIAEVRPYGVEVWLKSTGLSAKTQAHLRGLLSCLIDFAMLTGARPEGANPMRLVKIKGASKRESEPRILAVEEFRAFLAHVEKEPYRTMILTAMCLGLRVSELLGLQWGDVDWEQSCIRIQRGIVRNRVGEVKTRYSAKAMPMVPEFAEVLKLWRVQTEFKAATDWLWASPAMGGQSPLFYTTLQKVVERAASKAGLEGIGWHTFRHSYRSWMDETGVSMAMQQKLMRHSDIRTTMNIYGDVLPKTMYEASGKVVKMVLQTA